MFAISVIVFLCFQSFTKSKCEIEKENDNSAVDEDVSFLGLMFLGHSHKKIWSTLHILCQHLYQKRLDHDGSAWALRVDSWIEQRIWTRVKIEAFPEAFLAEDFTIGLVKGIHANAIIKLFAFIYSIY